MPALIINGKQKTYDDANFPQTLSDLLAKMNIAEETVVAELDEQIIARAEFKTTKLKPDSNIELIRFVGGG